MADKVLDLSETIYELTQQYPDLINIMVDLGFTAIKNPIVRNTMGRKMTIPTGCQHMGKSLNEMEARLTELGYRILKDHEEDAI